MKFRPASAAVAFIGTSLLLLAGIRSAQAAEITIVSPSSYQDMEGEECFCRPSEPPYRYQQVFPAEDFLGLNNQPHWIVGFGPRADQSVTSPHTAYLPDNYVRLSTTERGPGNQSLVFDANFGSDVMEFYSGPLTMVADVAGPGPGPKEFYHADFPAGVTPFLYDPSQGNLLLDTIAWQGEFPKILADQDPGVQAVAGDPFATHGDRGAAAIFQFTFIPVTPGDYNASGTVEQGDLDLVLLNWGREGTQPPAGWVSHLPTGAIDQAELDGVLLNWGNTAVAGSAAGVPEPSSLALVGLGTLAFVLFRLRGRMHAFKIIVTLSLVVIPAANSLAALLDGIGAIGDSHTDEHQFSAAHSTARNWVEILASARGWNFGNFTTESRGEQ
jgi:hypothetical protein